MSDERDVAVLAASLPDWTLIAAHTDGSDAAVVDRMAGRRRAVTAALVERGAVLLPSDAELVLATFESVAEAVEAGFATVKLGAGVGIASGSVHDADGTHFGVGISTARRLALLMRYDVAIEHDTLLSIPMPDGVGASRAPEQREQAAGHRHHLLEDYR